MKPYVLLLMGLIVSIAIMGQQDNFNSMKNKSSQTFDDFKKKQTAKFDDYKTRKQFEFANFLEQKWEKYALMTGKEKPELPEPVEPPVADPADTLPDVEIPVLPAIIPLPEEKPTPLPEIPIVPDNVVYNKVTLEFAGHKLAINYDKKFNAFLPQITEDKMADFWRTMAGGSFDELIYQCLLIKKELRLNDWAYYLFVKTLAANIYSPSQKHEQIAFIAFILDNSDYKVRMGRDGDYKNLLLLLAVQDQMYKKSYFIFSDEKFYLIEGELGSSIYTYNEWEKVSGKKAMNLAIRESIKVSGQYQTKVIETQALGGSLEINYNPQLKDFYNQMPDCDLAITFNSECSEELSVSLIAAIRKRLEGKNKLEQVAALLNFMHEGFPYMTDNNQFGYEKYFFYEESFIYPYSDCEDNSVLFAYLVRKLTGFPVVGLLYHDHAATAVKLDQDIDGAYVMHKGEKYTICDPTYLGARVGQAMPQYWNESAQIIEIR
jgi:hypothetical protein